MRDASLQAHAAHLNRLTQASVDRIARIRTGLWFEFLKRVRRWKYELRPVAGFSMEKFRRWKVTFRRYPGLVVRFEPLCLITFAGDPGLPVFRVHVHFGSRHSFYLVKTKYLGEIPTLIRQLNRFDDRLPDRHGLVAAWLAPVGEGNHPWQVVEG